MYKHYYFLLLISVLFFSSCEKEYQFKLETPKKIQINQPLNVSLTEINAQKIDKITYSLDGKAIENPSNFDISNAKLGNHSISAIAYFGNKTKKTTNTITFLADKPYDVYDFKIINTYPHDPTAYTQGLEYHNGYLYESTGTRGQSTLRKVELKTGKVIQKIELDDAFFGEGMTIYKDKIYQLTWESKKGFIYNLDDFKQIGTFDYGRSVEGWGLANSGDVIYKSDGTSKIWILDSDTLKEKTAIEVCTDKHPVAKLNELEFINGKLYSNVYTNSSIAIINPKNGAVEAVADMNPLVKLMKKKQRLDGNEVLNGIAYDKENNRIFITGKHWNSLFEIELVKKE